MVSQHPLKYLTLSVSPLYPVRKAARFDQSAGHLPCAIRPGLH